MTRTTHTDSSTSATHPGARSTAGFPSPADDYIEGHLDLNRALIKHPAATFFMRATGNGLHDVGIAHRDLLIVDRSRQPGPSSIVVAVIDGELQVRRVHDLRCSDVNGNEANEIWGVVTCVIHEFHH